MSEKRIGVIWNPSKTDGEELRAVVEATFGSQVRWWETTVDDPGTGMAAEAVAAGCEIVIAVGGDGTVRHVAEGVAGADVELGVVPQGTGNLLARNLRIPLNDIPAALERIREGEAQPIDLGWVRYGDEEMAFTVMIGFGLDAQMLVETDDDLKDRAGWLAYVEAMGRALSGTEMTSITLALDGGEPAELEGHTLLIGNCGMIQGGLQLLPDALPDDGLLDLLLISSEGPLQWMDTVRSVVWDNGVRRFLTRGQEAVDTDSTNHLQAASIRVELDAPQAFEVDGEELGEVTSFEVRVQPAALRVL